MAAICSLSLPPSLRCAATHGCELTVTVHERGGESFLQLVSVVGLHTEGAHVT